MGNANEQTCCGQYARAARELAAQFAPTVVLCIGCDVLAAELNGLGMDVRTTDASSERVDLAVLYGDAEQLTHDTAARLCSLTDTVVFCTAPGTLLRGDWVVLFAENGFYEDLHCRLSAMTADAVCYRRRENAMEQLEAYARYVRQMRWKQEEAAEHTPSGREEADMAERLANAEEKLAEIQATTSWRVTAPLRFLIRNLKKIPGLLLRCVRKRPHLPGRAKRWLGRNAKNLYHAAKDCGENTVKLKRKIRRTAAWPPHLSHPADGSAAAVSPDCRRAAIYTFYDRDGVVDEYVLYYLKTLSAFAERLLVVVNGSLQAQGRAALEALGCEVLVRENRGFDAWGVKAGIAHIGFDALAQYDEVIVSNNTILGPVCDLGGMFTEMSARKVDFWGIAAHAESADMGMFNCNPYGCLPEHIQSFFYAVRGRLLRGEAFRRFWTELPELADYGAAVGLYETVMTRYFSDAGYAWSSYMDSSDYYELTDNPLITMPMEAMRDWKCPFFKRRAFFQDYLYLTVETGHQSVTTLVQYLEEDTDYPMDLVWPNLIRTCHMSDLVQNMHLLKIFDRENSFALHSEVRRPKAALFMHIYDHTMAPELAHYAASMPDDADIFISTVSAEKKTAIEKAFASLPNRLEIRVLPNRGRDVSALLTSFRDVVMNYEVACVTHDKKTGYLKPLSVGEGFAYMGYENILGGRIFVEQVLQSFAQDSYLGFLAAPDPNHADFCAHVALEWGHNFENTKRLAAELGITVPMDEAHAPTTAYGSSFWFRTAALKPLFAKEWTYDDFPPEPFNATDGSILHAIERIYPYAAQQAGYYSAMLMTADYASVDIVNLSYYAREYTHVCYESGISPWFVYASVQEACGRVLGVPGQMLSPLRRLLRRVRRKLKSWADMT